MEREELLDALARVLSACAHVDRPPCMECVQETIYRAYDQGWVDRGCAALAKEGE